MAIQIQDIQQRLQQLRTEIAKGEQQLDALEQRREDIERTLLRLAGAVQVLSELLATDTQPHSTAESASGLAAAG